VEFSSS